MKVPAISSICTPIKKIAKEAAAPLVVAASIVGLGSCAGEQPKDRFEKDGKVITITLGNSQKSDVQEINGKKVRVVKVAAPKLEDVELTEGVVRNRNPKEIEKITGLRPKEFEVVNKAIGKYINKIYSKNYGNFYYNGTELDHYTLFPDNFYIHYSNGYKTKKYSWEGEFFKPERGGFPRFKITREKNNDFSLILINNYLGETEILNFTKDGVLKEGSYLPDENEAPARVQNEERIKENNGLRGLEADIKNITFFKNDNARVISKFINALGLSGLEHINKKGSDIFFLSGNDYSYRLNVKRSADDENTIIGIANKVTNSGESEIYLVKGEILSTNKSDKLIISKMRVVQDGLSDDSPVSNKNIKETKKTGTNTTTGSHSLNGQARTPWLRNLFSVNHRKFYEGSISSQAVNEINELVTESNSDLRTLKIISIDKRTGKVTVQGN